MDKTPLQQDETLAYLQHDFIINYDVKCRMGDELTAEV